ncbi:MAG: hypothetical protein QUS07_06105 [Methanothrix sp.]|nr:hypothetical protein [Methanothrix sp.]HOV51929.1 hypothetical protein [Methanothrix sp.]
MKTIVALVALTCLFGVAAAQTMFTGEGYSSSQLAFYTAPSSSTFEPNVQTYWQNYITGAQNATTSSVMSNMAIWMNAFPLRFNTPVALTGTSFNANAAAPSLSSSELNSQSLTRDINTKFSIYETRPYVPLNSSISVSKSSGVPGNDASGQIMSQNIMSLFNV